MFSVRCATGDKIEPLFGATIRWLGRTVVRFPEFWNGKCHQWSVGPKTSNYMLTKSISNLPNRPTNLPGTSCMQKCIWGIWLLRQVLYIPVILSKTNLLQQTPQETSACLMLRWFSRSALLLRASRFEFAGSPQIIFANYANLTQDIRIPQCLSWTYCRTRINKYDNEHPG
jgi:hypothetical protein